MAKINGKCRTNLDNYTCPVTSFVALPRIGDRVEVMYKGSRSTLKIIEITHIDEDGKPSIIVELTKSNHLI